MDVSSLVKRLSKERNKRPLIRGLNDEELKYFIEANLEKRKAVYQMAHITVNGSSLSAQGVAEKISAEITRRS